LENPQPPQKEKVDQAAQELFTCLLSNNLTEAESVAAIAMALAIRVAYASKDLEEVELKLGKFPQIFQHYCRANLSSIQSTILMRDEAQKGMH